MASLDPFLKAIRQAGAEALLLTPGRPPCLRRAGEEREVAKPRLDGGRIQRLLAELAGVDLPAALPGARNEFAYQLEGEAFQFVLTGTAGGWSAVAAPASAAAPASPGRAPRSAEELLRLLVSRGGSDLHLCAGQPPRLRVDGAMVELAEFAAAGDAAVLALLEPLLPPRNAAQFAAASDTDFAHEIPDQGRFRVNVFRDRSGVGAVFRRIPHRVPTFEELGLPESLRALAQLSKGLVLVTGPTGSGKSTTLAALVDLINRTRNDHIITIEDPVEFVHSSQGCLVNQREVGVHTGSFQSALRAALREDPDIVLVGEMRDLETASIAIETAETGHLVLGTLHTTTAPSTIERLVDQFPGDRQGQIRMMLAESLRAVIAQTLLRKVGGGRVAAFEILIGTPAVANLVREGKTFQIASAMQTGRKLGMRLLNDSLVELVQKGLVLPTEAHLKAVDKDGLLNRFRTAEIRFEPAAAGG